MFYCSSVVIKGIFLPTCPNWAMSRRLAICSDMDRVPAASRQKRGRRPPPPAPPPRWEEGAMGEVGPSYPCPSEKGGGGVG
eukprot:scaffold32794_cov90-Isochrysis_galbana.AAC.1